MTRAADVFDVPRASLYRTRRPPPAMPAPPRALTATERDGVLAVLHTDRFVDVAPKGVCATLLDEGVYLCSWRTMYRVLAMEAQFKTLKYRPDFPKRFGAIQDARAHCHVFFPCHDAEHRHGALGLLTPHDVHYGHAKQRLAARAAVLVAAHAAHPERFPRGFRNRLRVPAKSGSIHPDPERPRRRSYTNLMNPLSHSC